MYELLKSAQLREICSEPQIIAWFVINCTPLHCVYRGGLGGGGFALNRKWSPGL